MSNKLTLIWRIGLVVFCLVMNLGITSVPSALGASLGNPSREISQDLSSNISLDAISPQPVDPQLTTPQPLESNLPKSAYTEEQLQTGNALTQQAFALTEQGKFAEAESYWTELIEEFPENPALWSNRGNAKVSQNNLKSAIADFDQAIKLAPTATDPYLNRGTAWEGLGEWSKAIADYHQVLALDPQDAMGYNNLGNAFAGQGKWSEAIAYYQKATELAPNFAFARANYALALYQVGETAKSLQTMRNIVRKYPQFADMRAALTAVLWNNGKQGEAESNWVAAIGLDPRYRNLQWLEVNRRWPPQMVAALEKFLKLQ